jgi:undecaprenyl-diphosphatase
VFSVDVVLLRAVYAGSARAPWAQALELVSFLGSGWVLWALMPVFVFPSLRRHRGRATALLGVVLSTAAVVCVIKALTGRVRPCHALEWAGAQSIRLPNDFSFPSGHAAGAFAVAGFVCAVHRPLGVALFVVAALIAFSRVALGMHYPSDVAAGALLGTFVGLCWGRHTRRHDPA